MLNILIFVKIQQNLASLNLFISVHIASSFGIIHKSTITSAICLNHKQKVRGRIKILNMNSTYDFLGKVTKQMLKVGEKIANIQRKKQE